MKLKSLSLLLVCLLGLQLAQAQTVGILPQPKNLELAEGSFHLTTSTSLVAGKKESSTALYLQNFLKEATGEKLKTSKKAKSNSIQLQLDANLESELGTEGYQLQITPKKVLLSAAKETGLFYGIQSLRQLLPTSVENEKQETKLDFQLPALSITDTPRFAWRALMLDEARYFKGKEEVLKLLDQMALLKMNVFHWHLTDDAGWRLEIKKYPKLTTIGSKRKDTQSGGWNSTTTLGQPHEGFYTQEEVKEIIAYASDRHIKVVPEIEMPGHASAAIAAYPWLGTISQNIEVPVTFGKKDAVYNVADPRVIQFQKDVLDETMALFPSQVIHIGGDEVRFDEWKKSEEIQALMKKEGLKSPADVQIHFTNQISRYIESKGRRMMGWNEIMGGNVHEWQKSEDVEVATSLAKSSVIHFWKGDPKLINEAVESGYDIVNSYHIFTYLDYGYNYITLEKAYNFNPIPAELDAQYHSKVKGLGCQMWGEWIPSVKDMERQIYPRIAAYAEVGWSQTNQKDYNKFMERLKAIQERWGLKGIQYYKNTPSL